MLVPKSANLLIRLMTTSVGTGFENRRIRCNKNKIDCSGGWE